jgi:type IV pilus assembly protein PilM
MAREKLCVGVDIGASSIKLCQLKKNSRGLTLERFGVVALPPQTVVDGALMNSARVVDALKELIETHNVKRKQVALAISGHSVIIKKIVLPQMTREELEASINFEAEQFIPFDINDVFIDVQILGPSAAGQSQMDVVLVAAKKDYVNEYTSVLMEAGLDPVVCDVDAFALENAFAENYDRFAIPSVALVNVGAAKTNINIINQGASAFTRDLAIGGHSFTEEIQKQLGVSYEEGEALKLGGTLSEQTQKALGQVADNLTSEIQRSIDFYGATSADASPGHIYLSGGSARLGLVAQTIKERLNIPVEIADPFRKISTGTLDERFLLSQAPAAAVAVGLALRYPGDG